ncbi:hypothetical protein HK101_002746 [Irineochytrium annulatum]|nr:hypothetical protein HK101_002746 [Irineochytrium annulatum]
MFALPGADRKWKLAHTLALLLCTVTLLLQFLVVSSPPRNDDPLQPFLRADIDLPPAAIEYQASLRKGHGNGNASAEADGVGITLDQVDAILAEAADVNRTIVLLPYNVAFVDILSNLLCSIRRVEARHNVKLPLVFWPLDEGAYRWSQERRLGSILYDNSLYAVSDFVGYTENKDEKRTPYFRMMRERGKMFRKIVHDLGYNMFFIDTDVVLLGNPLDLLRWDSSVEIQVDALGGQALMEEIESKPGPEEVKLQRESVEAGLVRVLSHPANPSPIPFFRPESSYAYPDKPVIGCAGTFFIRADEGGRHVARELERILAEHQDIDDQQALNHILYHQGWPRNLAPIDRPEEDVTGKAASRRVLTYRYLPQYEAVNGHIFFESHGEYERIKREHRMPEPTLVHANGLQNKVTSIVFSTLVESLMSLPIYRRQDFGNMGCGTCMISWVA